jgi:predicted O-methyltransferase YrrM
VADPNCQDSMVRGVQRFNELLAAEPRASATIVQTVGAKEYDGFAMAVIDG